MKTRTAIIPALLLSIYTIIGISGCDSKAKEKEAVAAAMESIKSLMSKGEMGELELELEAVSLTDTPEEFQKAFLEFKSAVHNYNVHPDKYKQKGKKFDTMDFLKWHEKKMAPVNNAYAFLELKAAESVPEIKESLEYQSQFQKEVNERLKEN